MTGIANIRPIKTFITCCIVLAGWLPGFTPAAQTGKFMAAVANPYAAEVAIDIMRQGGSAVDAAIATQLVLSLVEPQSSGIGGGAFLLHYDSASGSVAAYDGRETAPRAATEELFLTDGSPMEFFEAVVGGQSVGAPGVIRMLEMAHQHHGHLPWDTLFRPAITLADHGFKVSPRLNMLIEKDKYLGTQIIARHYFYHLDGSARRVGEIRRNPEYASALKLIAAGGGDAFYRGPLAQEIVDTVRSAANPGLLAMEDLTDYRAVRREAVCAPYRNTRVCGMPPPTSGGVTVLQILGILENFDLGTLAPDSTEAIHIISEASRLAYADRSIYLADPDFVRVPVNDLLDPDYLGNRALMIDREASRGKAIPGTLPRQASHFRESGWSPDYPSTTHFSIVDAAGNAVSMTSSIENAFGSRLMARGFLLNNQLTDFSFRPTMDGNRVANRVEPGKRPRSSMSPTLIFDETGQLQYVLGSPGGSRIIAYVARTIIGLVDWKLDPQQAVSLPHHVNRNGSTELEADTALIDLQASLENMGHEVETKPLVSGLHVIGITADGLDGGADPRREGVVLGH